MYYDDEMYELMIARDKEQKEAKEVKEAQSKVLNQTDYLINRLVSQEKTPDEYFLDVTYKNYSVVLVPPEIRNDEMFALSVVEFKPDAYKHFSDEIKQNYTIASLAMKDGSMYEHAPEEVRASKELALEAIKTFPMASKYLPDTLKADKEIALATVSKIGFTLKVFSPELRADKEVALAAVTSNPNAFIFADDAIKRDTEVLFKAADFLQSNSASKFKNEPWFQSSKQLLSEHIQMMAKESLSELCDWIREQPQRIANLDDNIKTNKHLVLAAKDFIKEAIKQDVVEPWVIEAHEKILQTERFTRATASVQAVKPTNTNTEKLRNVNTLK